MTAVTRPHLIPLEELSGAIVNTLRAAPRTINELARLTGYSTSAVNSHLYDLFDDDQVYRKTSGRTYLWHYGRPDGSPPPVKVKIEGPHRDPLVAALFGHAPSCVPSASGMHSPSIDSAPANATDIVLPSEAGLTIHRGNA